MAMAGQRLPHAAAIAEGAWRASRGYLESFE